MAKQTFEIEVPFFCGYYESPLYDSDTLYREMECDGLEHYREMYGDDTLEVDDFDIDYDRYTDDCNKAFVSAFFDCIECPEFVEEMEFVEMVSPRYYNFATDRIFAKVTLADDWREQVMAFANANKDWLSKHIEEDWTSYDGFMSFMDNVCDDWLAELKKDDPDPRYIGGIIGYMMLRENKDVRDNIIYGTLDNFYVGDYVVCTKDGVSAKGAV